MKVFKEATLLTLGALLLCGMVYAIFIPGQLGSTPPGWAEKRIARTLQELASAQATYRSIVPGGGYWRKNISGLYTQPGLDGRPLHLIELSLAVSDSQLSTTIELFGPCPKAGYWYRALHFPGETTAAPDRFAVCASPVAKSAGLWMYVLNEKAVIYRKACPDTKPVEVYPADPEKEGWEKLPP